MSRELILARIRAACADVGDEQPFSRRLPRDYRIGTDLSGEPLIELFADRVRHYRAGFEAVTADEVPKVLGRILADHGAVEVAIPAGLDGARLPEGIAVHRDSHDNPLDLTALQRLPAVITGSAVAIAETGTVVLDGRPECGRRALHLVPDVHVCLVAQSDLVDDVPAAVRSLAPTAASGPLTWVSGPSATSDIELTRVEGVHGPRHLYVVLIRS